MDQQTAAHCCQRKHIDSTSMRSRHMDPVCPALEYTMSRRLIVASPAIAHQHTDLEIALAELAHAQAKTERTLDRLSTEMREFKDEMREFKDEMREFKDEMREFKDEMREFKDEMSVFKDEMRASSKASDKRWGELSNKMGTLVEDIIAPGIPEVFRNLYQSDQEAEIIVRTRRRHRESGARREFDTAAWIDGY
ncbi:MAG: hypothetical protein MUF51_07850, partial [Vicinamibacteria bacterium]|nr:hypothetical protein [Vicinamibacteria bacterium]